MRVRAFNVFLLFVIFVLICIILLILLLPKPKQYQAIPQQKEVVTVVREVPAACAPCPPCEVSTCTTKSHETDPVTERDVRVLHDEFYPPLNRMDADTMRNMNIYPVASRGSNDTYRLVGYLVDETDKNEVWKLFARQQYTGGRSEFYASPANRNFEMKVTLDNNVVTSSEKFRDLYTMPDWVTISHPMFSRNQYKVIQLNQSDFSSQYV